MSFWTLYPFGIILIASMCRCFLQGCSPLCNFSLSLCFNSTHFHIQIKVSSAWSAWGLVLRLNGFPLPDNFSKWPSSMECNILCSTIFIISVSDLPNNPVNTIFCLSRWSQNELYKNSAIVVTIIVFYENWFGTYLLWKVFILGIHSNNSQSKCSKFATNFQIIINLLQFSINLAYVSHVSLWHFLNHWEPIRHYSTSLRH